MLHHSNPTVLSLLDHPIGASQHSWRDRDADGPGRLDVEYQFILGRLMNRKVCRSRALEYAVNVARRSLEILVNVGARSEPTRLARRTKGCSQSRATFVLEEQR